MKNNTLYKIDIKKISILFIIFCFNSLASSKTILYNIDDVSSINIQYLPINCEIKQKLPKIKRNKKKERKIDKIKAISINKIDVKAIKEVEKIEEKIETPIQLKEKEEEVSISENNPEEKIVQAIEVPNKKIIHKNIYLIEDKFYEEDKNIKPITIKYKDNSSFKCEKKWARFISEKDLESIDSKINEQIFQINKKI